MKCGKCEKEAIIYQRYSGMHLCSYHFKEDVERKVKRNIRKYSMIGKGEKIAVALSGGKDSSVLLYVLKRIFQ
ncbi:MAG: TIGR00269 family protein, partial [Candidatus Syntropharchaeia archaeon]